MGAIKEGPNHGDRRHEGSGGAPHGSPSRLFRLPQLVGEMLGQKWRGKEAMKRFAVACSVLYGLISQDHHSLEVRLQP